ncbi:unnamed protein product [Cyprideis torosa]|uniref:Uncharacterized protein n=1 Tax=Cyprideis torosa TaxID=163714 RepID=A0A7R8ZNH0_9CRUS|nr:unnamed protein product [Cyprideis torosa]CAG0886328.1 unnamed protein product [Cyprideis torosa]
MSCKYLAVDLLEEELKDDHEKRRGSFTRAPPKKGKKSGKVPDKINKELEKRQLKMYSDSEKNILNKLLKRRGGKEKEGGKKQMSASKLNLDLVIDGEGGKGGSEGASASPKKKPKGGRKNSQGHAA